MSTPPAYHQSYPVADSEINLAEMGRRSENNSYPSHVSPLRVRRNGAFQQLDEGLDILSSEIENPRPDIKVPQRVQFGEFMIWISYQTIWASAIALSLAFWIFIGIGCATRHACHRVNSHYWWAHALLLVFVFYEFIINDLIFLPIHVIITIGYSCIWYLFSFTFWYFTGSTMIPQDPRLGKPIKGFIFWPAWALLNTLSFFIAFGIQWLLEKYIKSSRRIR